MKILATKLQERSDALTAARAAAESGDEAEFKTAEERIAALDAEITEIEERSKRLSVLETSGQDTEERLAKPTNAPITDKHPLPTGGESRAKFASLGHQLQEIRHFEVHKAHRPDGVYDMRRKYAAAEERQSGYSGKVDQDGGLLIEPEFANDLMPMILSDAGLFGRTMSRPVSGRTFAVNQLKSYSKASSFTGAAVTYWLDEAEAVTASKAEFERVELSLRKVAALYYATEELLEDTAALGPEIDEAVATEIRMAIDESILRGNGTSRPQGILNAGGIITVLKETGQEAATIVAENVIKMWSRMPAAMRANAVWLYNQQIEPQLPLLNLASGTAGALIFMPAGGLTQSPHASLFGRPMVACEFCSALGTPGDLMFVDLQQYRTIYKNLGISRAMSIHVKFLEAEVAFRFLLRVDGRMKHTAVFTPKYGTGHTLSSAVVLAERA